MKLYFITAEHRYVHRQSDIPKGADFRVDEVPTDLAGLMSHLNVLHQQMKEPPPAEPAPAPIVIPERSYQEIVLTQIAVEEAIQNADPVALASYAANVCWRIKELAKS
jgi:hypothetical protein